MRRTILLLLLALTLPACQRPPMVMPGIFAAGRIDPLADVPEAQRQSTHTLFYATDRVYDAAKDNWRQYTRLRAGSLDLGTVDIRFGDDNAWPAIAAGMRAQPQGTRFRPKITAMRRHGTLATLTESESNKPSDIFVAYPGTGKQFIEQLDAAVDQSAGKDITIYLHGFKNNFEQAVLTAAEYDLYTGGLGPFIVYSWPSYNSLWEYSHDRDSVRYTTAHARQFVEFLANAINAGQLSAENIHFVAHSSGAEIVGTVLRELALMSRDLTAQERQEKWRIGSVLLIAPDISTDVARERLLKEDLGGMFEQLIVYSSIHDRALGWAARMLYRTPRIGAITESDLTEQDIYWLGQSKSVAIVDTDSHPYGGFVNHSHHRFSPAVASDIILSLRSQLTPEQRGLVRDQGKVIWHFADDYPHRVLQAAQQTYPPLPPK